MAMTQTHRDYEDQLISFLNAINGYFITLRDILYSHFESSNQISNYYYCFTNPSKCTYSGGHSHANCYEWPPFIVA